MSEQNKNVTHSSEKEMQKNAEHKKDVQAHPRHKKIDPVKKKHKKINRRLILILLCASMAVAAAFIINIVRVIRTSSATTAGREQAMSSETNRSMKNDQYEIGNNPTKVEQQYFQELTDALKSGDDSATAAAVVKCFISDYFTMTNKDGNYEIGGLQYIYADKSKAFETWARYHYYADLDLYIHQYGRNKLLEVKEITIDQGPDLTDDMELSAWDTPLTFDTYAVHAVWSYQSGTSLDVSKYPQGAWFYVVDDNGRMEIAAYYTDNEAAVTGQSAATASPSSESEEG